MKNNLTETTLRKVFDIPSDTLMSEGEVNYHSSLVPFWDVLLKTKKIRFLIEYDNSLTDLIPVRHQNQVNSHIYKPYYCFNEKTQELVCSVVSDNVLYHTLRSLSKTLRHLNKKIDLKIEIENKKQSYKENCFSWKLNDLVLIGRCQSVLNYMRLLWLMENNYINRREFDKLSVRLEKQRLKPLKYVENIYNFEKVDKELNINHFQNKSQVISGFNCNYWGKNISVVQLSWGVTMTRDMMGTIFELNPNIKKIGVVGGVGYVGKNDVEVDDIFYPNSLVQGNDKWGYKITPIDNSMIDKIENKYFFNKKTTSGGIYSVVPKKHVISNFDRVKNNDDKIMAFDMEAVAFSEKISQNKKVDFAACYYIMDIPLKGLGLGNTYYNLEFLQELFEQPNRGKYFCMEKVIRFLTQKQ